MAQKKTAGQVFDEWAAERAAQAGVPAPVVPVVAAKPGPLPEEYLRESVAPGEKSDFEKIMAVVAPGVPVPTERELRESRTQWLKPIEREPRQEALLSGLVAQDIAFHKKPEGGGMSTAEAYQAAQEMRRDITTTTGRFGKPEDSTGVATAIGRKIVRGIAAATGKESAPTAVTSAYLEAQPVDILPSFGSEREALRAKIGGEGVLVMPPQVEFAEKPKESPRERETKKLQDWYRNEKQRTDARLRAGTIGAEEYKEQTDAREKRYADERSRIAKLRAEASGGFLDVMLTPMERDIEERVGKETGAVEAVSQAFRKPQAVPMANKDVTAAQKQVQEALAEIDAFRADAATRIGEGLRAGDLDEQGYRDALADLDEEVAARKEAKAREIGGYVPSLPREMLNVVVRPLRSAAEQAATAIVEGPGDVDWMEVASLAPGPWLAYKQAQAGIKALSETGKVTLERVKQQLGYNPLNPAENPLLPLLWKRTAIAAIPWSVRLAAGASEAGPQEPPEKVLADLRTNLPIIVKEESVAQIEAALQEVMNAFHSGKVEMEGEKQGEILETPEANLIRKLSQIAHAAIVSKPGRALARAGLSDRSYKPDVWLFGAPEEIAEAVLENMPEPGATSRAFATIEDGAANFMLNELPKGIISDNMRLGIFLSSLFNPMEFLDADYWRDYANSVATTRGFYEEAQGYAREVNLPPQAAKWLVGAGLLMDVLLPSESIVGMPFEGVRVGKMIKAADAPMRAAGASVPERLRLASEIVDARLRERSPVVKAATKPSKERLPAAPRDINAVVNLAQERALVAQAANTGDVRLPKDVETVARQVFESLGGDWATGRADFINHLHPDPGLGPNVFKPEPIRPNFEGIKEFKPPVRSRKAESSYWGRLKKDEAGKVKVSGEDLQRQMQIPTRGKGSTMNPGALWGAVVRYSMEENNRAKFPTQWVPITERTIVPEERRGWILDQTRERLRAAIGGTDAAELAKRIEMAVTPTGKKEARIPLSGGATGREAIGLQALVSEASRFGIDQAIPDRLKKPGITPTDWSYVTPHEWVAIVTTTIDGIAGGGTARARAIENMPLTTLEALHAAVFREGKWTPQGKQQPGIAKLLIPENVEAWVRKYATKDEFRRMTPELAEMFDAFMRDLGRIPEELISRAERVTRDYWARLAGKAGMDPGLARIPHEARGQLLGLFQGKGLVNPRLLQDVFAEMAPPVRLDPSTHEALSVLRGGKELPSVAETAAAATAATGAKQAADTATIAARQTAAKTAAEAAAKAHRATSEEALARIAKTEASEARLAANVAAKKATSAQRKATLTSAASVAKSADTEAAIARSKAAAAQSVAATAEAAKAATSTKASRAAATAVRKEAALKAALTKVQAAVDAEAAARTEATVKKTAAARSRAHDAYVNLREAKAAADAARAENAAAAAEALTEARIARAAASEAATTFKTSDAAVSAANVAETMAEQARAKAATAGEAARLAAVDEVDAVARFDAAVNEAKTAKTDAAAAQAEYAKAARLAQAATMREAGAIVGAQQAAVQFDQWFQSAARLIESDRIAGVSNLELRAMSRIRAGKITDADVSVITLGVAKRAKAMEARAEQIVLAWSGKASEQVLTEPTREKLGFLSERTKEWQPGVYELFYSGRWDELERVYIKGTKKPQERTRVIEELLALCIADDKVARFYEDLTRMDINLTSEELWRQSRAKPPTNVDVLRRRDRLYDWFDAVGAADQERNLLYKAYVYKQRGLDAAIEADGLPELIFKADTEAEARKGKPNAKEGQNEKDLRVVSHAIKGNGGLPNEGEAKRVIGAMRQEMQARGMNAAVLEGPVPRVEDLDVLQRDVAQAAREIMSGEDGLNIIYDAATGKEWERSGRVFDPVARPLAQNMLDRYGYEHAAKLTTDFVPWKGPSGQETLLPRVIGNHIAETLEWAAPLAGKFSGDAFLEKHLPTLTAALDPDALARLTSRIKQGLTVGLLVPHTAFLSMQAMGNLLYIYQWQGFGGVARNVSVAFRNPRAVVEVVEGMRAQFPGLARKRAIVTRAGAIYTTDHITDMALRYGLDSSVVASNFERVAQEDMARFLTTGGYLKDKVASVVGGGALGRGIRDIGGVADTTFRTTVFMDGLERGLDPADAARVARDVVLDYSKLSDFEKSVMRNVIIFYAYTRRNAASFYWNLLKHPERIGAQLRAGEAAKKYHLRDEARLLTNDFTASRIMAWYRPTKGYIPGYQGVGFAPPQIPIMDSITLMAQIMNFNEPEAKMALIGRGTPLLTFAASMAYEADERFRMPIEDARQNIVPAWFVAYDYAATGGAFQRIFDIRLMESQDPRDAIDWEGGNRGVYVAGNWLKWQGFKQLSGYERTIMEMEKLDRADLGVVEGPAHLAFAVRRGLGGPAPLIEHGLPLGSLAAPRPFLTAGEEALGTLTGVRGYGIPTREAVIAGHERAVNQAIEEAAKKQETILR